MLFAGSLLKRSTHHWRTTEVANPCGVQSLRCSRPLCSSQSTGGTSSYLCLPYQHRVYTTQRWAGSSPGIEVQDRDDMHNAVISGSVRSVSDPPRRGRAARSLRTQQRAKDQARGFETFRACCKQRSCTGLTNLSLGHNVNVPPMSATGDRAVQIEPLSPK